MHPRHLLAAATFLFMGGLLTLSAQGTDPFSGTWRARQFGVEQTWIIAKAGDKWTLKGTYHLGGKPHGSFAGEDVAVADGVMTFKHKVLEKSAGLTELFETSLTPKGGGLLFSHKPIKTRPPITYMLVRGTAVVPRPPDKGPDAALAGVWKGTGVAGVEEVWTVTNVDGKWDLKATFKSRTRLKGSAHAEGVIARGGMLSFTRVVDKSPGNSQYQGKTPCTLTGDGDRAELLVFGRGGRTPTSKVSLKREVVVVVKDKDPPTGKGDPDRDLTGTWEGEYPGLKYKVVVEVKKAGGNWGLQGWLVGEDGKLAGRWEKSSIEVLPGKAGLRAQPDWHRPKGVGINTNFVLAPDREDGMLFETWQGKKLASSTLKRGGEKTIAELTKKPETPKDAPIAVGHITGMGFTDEGKTLICGLSGGKIAFIDVEKRAITKTIDGNLAVSRFAVSPKGDFFVRGYHNVLKDGEGITEVFEPGNDKAKRTLPEMPTGQEALRISPDGKLLLSRDRGNLAKKLPPTLSLRSMEDGKVLVKVERPETQIATALAFSPDGKKFSWSGSVEHPTAGRVRVTVISDLKGKVLATLSGVHKGDVEACAFSPDGLSLATVDGWGQLAVWDLKTRKPRRGAVLGTKGGGLLEGVAFSPDSKIVMVGQREGNVYFRDAKTLEEVQSIRPFRNNVVHFAFSPKGQLAIATGGAATDGKVVFVDLPEVKGKGKK